MVVKSYSSLKVRLRVLPIGVGLLFIMIRVDAQQATVTLNSPNTSGTYTATQMITLSPGFSALGTTGFHAYITPNSLVSCNGLSASPSSDRNYVQTFTPKQPFVDASILASKNTCEMMQVIHYFDGLGRPMQMVQVKANPDATKDVIQPTAYDQFGRTATRYLPYTTNSASPGSYRSDALTPGSGVFGFYNPTGSGTSGTQQGNGIAIVPIPSALTVYEPSPLDRPLEQGSPGDAWQPASSRTSATGRTIVLDYQINNNISWASDPTNSFQVALYTATINPDGSRTLGRADSNTATYDAGKLSVTISRDENWISGRAGTTETYTDDWGHTVLRRRYNLVSGSIQVLSTYYIYDDLNELAFVLTPGVDPDNNPNIDQTALDTWCYQYRYDQKRRLVEKKLPAKGWECTVYNLLDKPVATQDAVQKAAHQWIVTKYDDLGRAIVTGVWNSTNDRLTLQASANSQAIQWENKDDSQTYGYTLTNTYPTSLSEVWSVNYYDDYNIVGLPSIYDKHTGFPVDTKGLATASKINVLGTTDMLWAVSYYDDKGRVAEAYRQHYLDGASHYSVDNYDVISNTYNFDNSIAATNRKHYNYHNTVAAALTVINTYVYDHMGRKRQTWEQVNGGMNVIISQEDYNEVGQQITKHLHSADNGITFLQDIRYNYNERGWLTQSSSPLFQELLQYNSVNNVSGITPTAQFNGNIASQSYGTSVSPNAKSYVYTYDAINRLIDGSSTDGYNEKNITYDKMGNIGTLKRYWSNTLIDDLTYNYMVGSNNTNQLQSVTDASGDASGIGYKSGSYSYGYDVNGNMNVDNSKGLGITLNLLNLPAVNTLTSGTINYIYDASGHKLRKISTLGIGTTTDYISGIQYTNGTIDFAQTEQGRVLNLTGTPNYEYTLTDHLGNSRVAFDSSTGASSPKQADDYLPFGLEISRATVPSLKNEYLYNNKELQEETGQYDYGARYYDPVIARWTTIDPLAEANRKSSPYNYVENNPIRNIDPDGMWTQTKNGYATNDPGEISELVDDLKAAQQRQEAFGQPTIISREQWHARKPVLKDVEGKAREWRKITENLAKYYNEIVIHHSGNDHNEWDIAGLQQFQQSLKDGFADVAYHFAIDKDGNIYEGRPIDIEGADVQGDNAHKIGIVLLADLDTKNEGVGENDNILKGTGKQLYEWASGNGKANIKMVYALFRLTQYLNVKYGIEYLGGHKEADTNRYCPGDLGMKVVEEMRRIFGLKVPISRQEKEFEKAIQPYEKDHTFSN